MLKQINVTKFLEKMIEWQFYPKSDYPNEKLLEVINVFKKSEKEIDSLKKNLISNEVLLKLRTDLLKIGFKVEKGKKLDQKINIPVLFGKNGKFEKYFNADAHNPELGIVIEVEAGRGVTNYQFLKDLFQACIMKDVDYLVIAIRKKYRHQKDFRTVCAFFDALYVSNRLKLPLKGILILGY